MYEIFGYEFSILDCFLIESWRKYFHFNLIDVKKEKKTKVDGKKNDQDLAALDWRKRSKMRQLMLHKLKVKTQLD